MASAREKLTAKPHFGKLLEVCFLADFRLFFLTGSYGLLSQENEEKEEKESVKEKVFRVLHKIPLKSIVFCKAPLRAEP